MSVLNTSDGSPTIEHPFFKELFHSRHGSLQESMTVYIEAGFSLMKDLKSLQILEMGFGSGLNVWLTYLQSLHTNQYIEYVALDAFPVETPLLKGYWEHAYWMQSLSTTEKEVLNKLTHCPWDSTCELSSHFVLHKIKCDFLTFQPEKKFDLCYYDAFAPEAQPELWDEKAMRHLASFIKQGGYVTSYCSKGVVQRNLKSAGFTIEKLPGPPGKREIIRAKMM